MVARGAAHATTVAVMPNRDLKLLDAADRAADLINELIDRSPHGRLLHVAQMRKSVQSIGANIS